MPREKTSAGAPQCLCRKTSTQATSTQAPSAGRRRALRGRHAPPLDVPAAVAFAPSPPRSAPRSTAGCCTANQSPAPTAPPGGPRPAPPPAPRPVRSGPRQRAEMRRHRAYRILTFRGGKEMFARGHRLELPPGEGRVGVVGLAQVGQGHREVAGVNGKGQRRGASRGERPAGRATARRHRRPWRTGPPARAAFGPPRRTARGSRAAPPRAGRRHGAPPAGPRPSEAWGRLSAPCRQRR